MADEAQAVAKFVRMSPTKVRRVMDLIRGKNVVEAMTILRFTPNRSSEVLAKVLKSAAANHTDRFGTTPDELVITRCWADPGPVLKRVKPRAMGRAYRIVKRTSHVTIAVAELEDRGATRRTPARRRPAAAAAGHTPAGHYHDHHHAGHTLYRRGLGTGDGGLGRASERQSNSVEPELP
jgi:large subunit ribosomal protein L22